jgi:hypothetical protein
MHTFTYNSNCLVLHSFILHDANHCTALCVILAITAASGKNEAAATQTARRARLEAREAAAAVTAVTAECETAAANVAAVAGPRTLVTRLKQVYFNLLNYSIGALLCCSCMLCSAACC